MPPKKNAPKFGEGFVELDEVLWDVHAPAFLGVNASARTVTKRDKQGNPAKGEVLLYLDPVSRAIAVVKPTGAIAMIPFERTRHVIPRG